MNEKVPKGTLGGFIENEKQSVMRRTCWIYDDAICCENGEVKEEAALYMAVWSRLCCCYRRYLLL